MKISIQQQKWSRLLVVTVLLALSIRYILWRIFCTLNFSNPLNSIFSLVLFFIEMSFVLITIFQMRLILKIKNRYLEADQMAKSVMDESFTPSVDIFIPTYNEPIVILKRTIVGCQTLDYIKKKIFILDDMQRSEMKRLATELGCEYISRTDNLHAKAGNLNNALFQTSGDLIVVFDADFVPTENFLTRTVGFFQNKSVSLVQTNQSFYNPDPIIRNLGLEKVLPHEAELFSRHYQVLRDGVGNAMCYGSSFVVRRKSLEEIGGFETESLSEDIYTSIKLSAQGYQLIYLDEKLSAGLSTENMKDHLFQQLRWTRGTIQSFFINANPLTIPGLRFSQRLNHIGGVLYRFNNISRLGLLIIPLAYSFFGITPIQIDIADLLYFLLPYYIAFLATYSWFNQKSQSYLMSEIYSLVHCFPLSVTVIKTMLSPFSKGFNVTPKNSSKKNPYFNWNLAFPMLTVFLSTLVSLYINFHNIMINGTGVIIILASLWSVYNLLLVGITLLALFDIPKTDVYEWFNLKRRVRINIESEGVKEIARYVSLEFLGISTAISEIGIDISLFQVSTENMLCLENDLITLEIIEDNIKLQGKITHKIYSDKTLNIRVMFEETTLNQYRQLIKILFCRFDQWPRPQTPGEFQILWLLLTVIINRIKNILAIN